jgi:hypothetical protein
MQMRLLAPPVACWPAGSGPRRSLVVLRRIFYHPPFLFFVHRPFVRLRAPLTAGRPSAVEGGEPQRGWAPGAAPDPRETVDDPHAAEGARCGCGRLLGHQRRGSGWRAAVVGEEQRGTSASRHGPGREAQVCRRRRSGEAGS